MSTATYPEIAAELQEIGPVVEVPRTSEMYRPLHPAEPPEDIAVVRDVAYGPHERNVLDVFTARAMGAASHRKPVLVYIHGGGFRAGAKRLPGQPFYDNVGTWAARNGMVGITISYRLAPEHVYPAGVEDLSLAVEYIRAHASGCGGDPARIFLWGHSAGAAHAADYIATAPAQGVAGAILTSGIYDKDDSGGVSRWSAYYGTDTSRYAALNPIPALVSGNVPLLVTWAEIDRPDFIADAHRLVHAFESAGRPLRKLLLPHHSHISELYAVGTADRSLSAPVLQFIQSNLGGTS
jgi:acetyl esterase/lipase